MPSFKGHISFSVLIYFLILWIFSLFSIPINVKFQWLISIVFGSLFPDIDTKSKGQKIFYLIVFTACLSSFFLKKFYLASSIGIFAFFPLLTKHRGLFHNIWFLIFMSIFLSELILSFFPGYKYIIRSNEVFFILGFISHLWLDLGLKRMFRVR